MNRLLTVCLLLASTTGCAAMRRHPAITGMVAGGAVGLTLGLVYRPPHCPSMINGYPYNGTPPCPNPATYDPGGKHR
jgi:hypothetical protein